MDATTSINKMVQEWPNKSNGLGNWGTKTDMNQVTAVSAPKAEEIQISLFLRLTKTEAVKSMAITKKSSAALAIIELLKSGATTITKSKLIRRPT